MRPSKVIANAFSAGFHLIARRALPFPVGSSARVARYKHLSAACSVGKCPRARAARLYRALTDSIAFVEQIPAGSRRRSLGTERTRSTRSPTSARSPDTADPRPAELGEPFLRRRLRRSGVDGFEITRHLVPVLPRGEPKCVAYQMNHACLHNSEFPHRVDRIRQSLAARHTRRCTHRRHHDS